MKIQYTGEQTAIHQSKVKVLVVRAYAGTGKTSSFIGYANAYPKVRMLYLAFSAAVRDEAKGKFPSNVRCSTGHGLAYSKYGTAYAHKLNNPKPYHLLKPLDLDPKSADTVIKTVNNFLQSGDMEILGRHAAFAAEGNQEKTNNIVRYARKAWELMQDVTNTDVPMPHDGYLKLFQLKGGIIREEVILLDEAQDTNGVLLAIVMASPGRKIFVGDTFQQIFSFRGAVNAMDMIDFEEELFLTASFRFGAGIARLANSIIGQYNALPKQLQGLGKHTTKYDVNIYAPHTRIARTNATLFDEAVFALRSNRPFGFVGGAKGAKLDNVLDAYYLYASQHSAIKDQMLASFMSFNDMRVYADATDDKELKSLIKVVEEYTSEIPSLVKKIQERALDDLSAADIILTTAHKSKGLEWDSVYLCDDFTDMLERIEDGKSIKPEKEEVNLLYVAVTRAHQCISLPEPLTKFLEEIRFYDAIPTKRGSIPGVRSQSAEEEIDAEIVRRVNESKPTILNSLMSFVMQPAETPVVHNHSEEKRKEMNAMAKSLIDSSESVRSIVLSSSMSAERIKAVLDYINQSEHLLKKAVTPN